MLINEECERKVWEEARDPMEEGGEVDEEIRNISRSKRKEPEEKSRKKRVRGWSCRGRSCLMYNETSQSRLVGQSRIKVYTGLEWAL